MMKGVSNHSMPVYSDAACDWTGWPDSGSCSRDIDGGADNTGCAKHTTGSHHHCHWTNHCCLHPHWPQHPTTWQGLGTHEWGTLLCLAPTCRNHRLYSSVHECKNYYQVNCTNHIQIGILIRGTKCSCVEYYTCLKVVWIFPYHWTVHSQKLSVGVAEYYLLFCRFCWGWSAVWEKYGWCLEPWRSAANRRV